MRDGLDKVVKDPDKRVQEAIDLAFGKFRQLWSLRQTFLWFYNQGVELPVHRPRGPGRKLVWQLPSYSFIREMLQNPFYAGAYFYGRRPTQIQWEEGQLCRRTKVLAQPEQWKVLIPDHHEDISWAMFEEHQRRIRGNSLKCASEPTVSAVRAGQGLLAVVVNLERERDLLCFTIDWKGGTHTQFEMPKPVSGVGRKTAAEDLEVIRQMAERYGDDEIARVLNKLGRTTATGQRWNQERVAVIRQRHELGGQKRALADPEILTMGQAAQHGQVSPSTIKKLAASGLVKKQQIVPWAPREIKRTELDSEPVRRVLQRLRQTGKLVLQGDNSAVQELVFQSNQPSDKARYYERIYQ